MPQDKSVQFPEFREEMIDGWRLKKGTFFAPGGARPPGVYMLPDRFRNIFLRVLPPPHTFKTRCTFACNIGIRDHGHLIFKKGKNARCLIPWENGYNERFNGTRGPHFMLQWRYAEVF